MPVERMRMRPWLEEQINGNRIPGLKWLNEELKIFQIPWMHAARHGWDVEKDAPLFRNWAIHTGKYQPGVDKADPKTWKANFRCAMNSLPDIEEVKDKSIKKGNNAYRVYRMLPLSERPTKKAKKIKMDGKEEKEEPMIYIKDVWSLVRRCRGMKRGGPTQQEYVDSSYQETNGVCQTNDYGEHSSEIKSEVDSTVNIIIVGSRTADMADEMIVSNPPDVCQVVEVTTESEEQNAGGKEHYPLQISPACSYAESETDSAPSDEERIAAMAMARLLWETPCKSEKSTPCSTGSRGSTHSATSSQTVVTSNKPDLQVTIKEECSPLPYNSSWPKFPETLPSPQVGSSASTSNKPDRVSVIKKTSDITQARVKTY